MARTSIDMELRWGDQDAYGHVNNVAFARFLEEARVRTFWLGSGRERTGMERHFRGDDPAGPKMLVANQQIEFLRVLEYSERPITVELWIGKLGGSSLEVHYEIVEGVSDSSGASSASGAGGSTGASGSTGAGGSTERSVVARAISHIVIVHGETMRPIRLSDEGRASVSEWMDEPVQMRRG
ncbi:hypothetical protein FM113_02195 [Leucobacter sp. 7(1)]|uniref:acyl-CoA thioesterase n=1 Tax=Leucobacter sp. 7(1) TaxID=1255613 RepID=UPI00097E7E43|nr:acyl-CoA thioesterase [Leucobacter sp. 7(1)]SJN08348.1 hypothetical protein FM113_02195 [Leucobacter sp. 7(1)]